MLPTYQEVPSYQDLQNIEEQWKIEFAKDEFYLRQITQDDKVYSYFKYDRKTNYKENIANSLGVLEHTQVFKVLHQLLTSIGLLSIGH